MDPRRHFIFSIRLIGSIRSRRWASRSFGERESQSWHEAFRSAFQCFQENLWELVEWAWQDELLTWQEAYLSRGFWVTGRDFVRHSQVWQAHLSLLRFRLFLLVYFLNFFVNLFNLGLALIHSDRGDEVWIVDAEVRWTRNNVGRLNVWATFAFKDNFYAGIDVFVDRGARFVYF